MVPARILKAVTSWFGRRLGVAGRAAGRHPTMPGLDLLEPRRLFAADLGGDVGPSPLPPLAAQRSVAFGGKTKAVFTDADGSRVAVSLKGPGTGTVVFDANVDVDPFQIVLADTTAASRVSVWGSTTVRGVSVAGSLKEFIGKALDLAGAFAATGSVRSLRLRSVSDAPITVGSGDDALSFAATTVFDASLTAAGAVRSVKVESWTDTGGAADAITAPAVGSLSSKGDFAADVAAGDVGKVKVGGALTGDVRSAGGIASVQVLSVAGASVFAGVAAGFVGLPDSIDDFANPAAVLKSFAVKGRFVGSFADARVAAPTIGRVAVGNIMASNGGTVLGLAADTFGSVRGDVDGIEKLKLKDLIDPSQSVSRTDAVIRVV